MHVRNDMKGDTVACIYHFACWMSCLKAEVPLQCLGLSGYQLVSLSDLILKNIYQVEEAHTFVFVIISIFSSGT